ncbi:EAL domain-containing protein [Chromohalobacter canadensis]|uniref:bifunctional diguanylate cyclase/phosphodiesterase n=1 Tax=Chromohalobacter canadensis TaxID=141389 RepID=UPI0021BFC82E|nr:sensor domain-containing phosphodiesterase [Chromohalobacter canadensis]MCT8469129.1 EAL domain-containing protein [Chromohalobacter canadensis]MCT8472681.1 EAL domain-containing protein [Chromohalobacter canadensis]MCT8500134.1 EAL domain-containing protein [Chromohalobacter canadensis]
MVNAPGAGAPDHDDETRRLDELQRLGLMDTPPEKRFDDITRLTARVFDVPIVLITLIDRHRQWFKSRFGLDACETSRDNAFCAHALLERQMLVIEDTASDPRFRDHPLVTDTPYIRFYAGAVIRMASGLPLGTLCVIDRHPRRFDVHQREILLDLARLVENEIGDDVITRLERARAETGTQLDPQTRLATQQRFQQLIQARLAALPETTAFCGVAAIDLYGMRAVRTRFSLQASNEVLMHGIARVEKALDGFVFDLARIDDQRLGVLLYQGNPARMADTMATLAETLRAPYIAAGKTVTAAARVVWAQDATQLGHADDILSALQHTCRRLHNERGDVLLRLDTPASLPRLTRRNLLRRRTASALAEDRFQLHYQPQVAIHGYRVKGFEALLRWYDSEMGQVSPQDIVDISEEIDLGEQLDTWVLQTVTRQLATWRDRGHALLPVSVNVSQEQLAQPAFADLIDSLLTRHRLPGRLLNLEVLERSLIDDPEAIIDSMQRLKRRGVGFAIDDFGTGYSSLSYLMRIPFDTLKIDKSFIDRICDDPRVASLVRSIVSLGRDAGMQVVAEGVESVAQVTLLRGFHCHSIQGHVFSIALTPPHAEALLAATARKRHHFPSDSSSSPGSV